MPEPDQIAPSPVDEAAREQPAVPPVPPAPPAPPAPPGSGAATAPPAAGPASQPPGPAAPPRPPNAGFPGPLTRQDLIAAAVRAGVGYASGFLVALLAVVALGITLATADDTSWTGGSEVSASGLGGALILPFLLVGMGLLGPLGASVGGQDSVSVFLAPLSITVALATGILLWSALRRRPAPSSTRALWLESVVTGGILGLGGAILAAAVRFSLDTGAGFLQFAVTIGVSPWGVFAGGLLLGTVATAVGLAMRSPRPVLSALGVTVPPVLRRSADALTAGAVPAVALVLVTLLVGGLVELGPTGTLTALLTVAPNAVILGLGIASLGGVQVSASGGGQSVGAVTTLFSHDVPPWAWVALLFPLIAVVVAGTRLRLLTRDPLPWSNAWASPAVLAAVTVVAAVLSHSRVTGSVSAGFLGSSTGHGSLHLAVWTVVVAAAWGLLVEVIARRLAPWVVAVLPAGAVRLLSTTRTGSAPAGPVPTSTPPAGGSDPAAGGPLPADDDGAHGAAPGIAVGAPLPTVDRRKALVVLGAVGGALVLVIGAVVARNVVATTVYSPAAPVEAYLDALERGDAEAALALADPDVPNSERTLLTNAVYGEVEERPAGASITDISRADDFASVTATYDQDGKKSTQTFSVRRTGSELLVFDRWELVAPEVPVVDLLSVADQDLDSVVVNGVEVDIASQTSGFRALPGRWEVTLPDGGAYVEAPTLTVLVGGPDDIGSPRPEGVSLRHTFTQAALDAAVEQETERLAQCLTSTAAEPEGCEFQDWSYRADEVTGATWAQTTAPTIRAEDEGTFVRVTVSGGEATRTGTMPGSASWYPSEPRPHEVSVDLRYTSDYVLQDGELVVGDPYDY